MRRSRRTFFAQHIAVFPNIFTALNFYFFLFTDPYMYFFYIPYVLARKLITNNMDIVQIAYKIVFNSLDRA